MKSGKPGIPPNAAPNGFAKVFKTPVILLIAGAIAEDILSVTSANKPPNKFSAAQSGRLTNLPKVCFSKFLIILLRPPNTFSNKQDKSPNFLSNLSFFSK